MRYFDFLHILGAFDTKDNIEYNVSMPVNTTRFAYEVVSNIIDILEKQSQ
jgi:hypothetical protein